MNILAALVIGTSSWFAVQGGAWQPSPEILGQVQSGLEPLVTAELNSRQKKPRFSYSDYTFQYQGQQSKSRKYVLVNAFCHKPDSDLDLTKDIYYVFDGGLCFFHAKYDPVTKQF